jgi:hypothetical protein
LAKWVVKVLLSIDLPRVAEVVPRFGGIYAEVLPRLIFYKLLVFSVLSILLPRLG